jgi:Na+/proline symporter
MLSKLGTGWLGLVVASIIAAYMSTIGTHLNWGSSYLVHDFYRRFIRPGAPERELVAAGRVTTLLLMIIGGTFALTFLNNATQAFDILLLSGAGSGAIYLLRWFWWRINAWTEIAAMIFATVMAVILVFVVPDEALVTEMLDAFTMKLLIAVGGTTVVWILTTLLTRPETKEILREFYMLTHPGGPGWKKVIKDAEAEGQNIDEAEAGKNWEMPSQILMVFIGCIVIYSSLFSIGSFVYGNNGTGILLAGVAAAGTFLLFRLLDKLRVN